MNLVERVMCLLGEHDWHVDRTKEGRINSDHFSSYSDGPTPHDLCCCMPSVFGLACGTLGLFVHWVAADWEWFRVFAYGTAISFVWLWLSSFTYRHRNWVDAMCVRCGKRRMELTKRETRERNTRRYFEELRDVDN